MLCSWRFAVAILCAALAGCNTTYSNPFGVPTPSVKPGPSAALLFTSDRDTPPGNRELYALNLDGTGLTRLTFCNNAGPCDTVEAAPGRDRIRVAVRRVQGDANGDGRLTAADGTALIHVNLENGIEGSLLPASANVSGIDWSHVEDTLVYCAAGTGGGEDIYRADTNGKNTRNLTSSGSVRERRVRIDPTGSIATFERLDESGKSQIWIFNTGSDQFAITTGGPGTETLAGTPYIVGSDADPDFSNDTKTAVVFRRLTSTGNGALGTWDLLTVSSVNTPPRLIATGPVFRGAPDWGASGILFAETDVAAGTSSLVLIQADGSGRRVLLTLTGGKQISSPRWLP
jgi:Tol biopolymer transport system component